MLVAAHVNDPQALENIRKEGEVSAAALAKRIDNRDCARRRQSVICLSFYTTRSPAASQWPANGRNLSTVGALCEGEHDL